MGGGAWWAAVHGVVKSRTRLKRLSSSSSSPGYCLPFWQGAKHAGFFLLLLFKSINYLFWAHHTVRGILVLQPGIKRAPPASGAWNLNRWTEREV